MLKIKDSVDLKELEKFGFEPKYDKVINVEENDLGEEIEKEISTLSYYSLNGLYEEKEHMGNGFTSRYGVTIYVKHRNIFLSCMLVGVKDIVYKHLYEGVVFDLIQAGLVEKVES